MSAPKALRGLPAIDELVARLHDLETPRPLLVAEARRVLSQMRAGILEGSELHPGEPEALLRETEAVAHSRD
jgi:hypothetical protein